MGKTSDLLKKTGDVKGTFHAMMGMINDRNGRGLTEAEEIKKWQEYAEELNKKKVLMTWITRMVWSLKLEPDILEWEVKWAQEAILQTKLVEVTEFQLSY